MRPPYRLVEPDGSTDTVQCLEHWLEQAKAGQLVGVAAVLIHRRRQFVVHACGEAHRSPVFTRGCVGMLEDQLGQQAREATK